MRSDELTKEVSTDGKEQRSRQPRGILVCKAPGDEGGTS